MIFVTRLFRQRPLNAPPAAQWRSYSDNKPKSTHAQWYADIVPAMIPIFLLGSAVYLGLQLTQVTLSQEKYMETATAHVKALEAEVAALQEKRTREPQETTENTNPTTPKRGWW